MSVHWVGREVLFALKKVIGKENGTSNVNGASFRMIKERVPHYSDSHVYSTLRKLETWGLVSISEDYVGYGYQVAPERSWTYRMTEGGHQQIAYWESAG